MATPNDAPVTGLKFMLRVKCDTRTPLLPFDVFDGGYSSKQSEGRGRTARAGRRAAGRQPRTPLGQEGRARW